MRSANDMRLILMSGIIMLLTFSASGQGFTENALLFSQTRPGGSARIQGMGGAQIALGGDFSSALSNPAGLGMFNRSEFTFSLANYQQDYSNTYYGQSSSDNSSRINLPALSLVLHYGRDTEATTGFLGGSLGISLTRIGDLNQEFSYRADNNQSSMIDYFIDFASHGNRINDNEYGPINPDDMLFGGPHFYNLTALAYNNYLIDDIYDINDNLVGYGSVLSKDPNFPEEVRTVNQIESVKRKGSQYQWSIAYGANFSDKVFVGANVGITTLRYKLEQSFEESDYRFSSDPGYDPLDYFRVDESLDIQGSGVNLSLGVIYRPAPFLQVGGSLTTPTFYQITDTYTASLSGRWNNFEHPNGDILNNTYEEFGESLLSEYSFSTPFKLSAGIAFISKYGFITADIEKMNHGKSKYSSDIEDISFSSDNREIKRMYGASTNFRVGAEGRYNIFRLRAGYSFMADPYLNNNGVDRSVTSISGGGGVRLNKFFGDIAVVKSEAKNLRTPYTPGDDLPTPGASQSIKTTNIMLTVGFTF